MLRGFVLGVREAKANKDEAIKILVDRVGIDAKYSERGYDDFINGIYEDGRMPSAEGMKSFWDVGIMSGDYTEAWPESKYLDRTFIDSFDGWKPE